MIRWYVKMVEHVSVVSAHALIFMKEKSVKVLHVSFKINILTYQLTHFIKNYSTPFPGPYTCQNNGTCNNGVCMCLAQYSGILCETNLSSTPSPTTTTLATATASVSSTSQCAMPAPTPTNGGKSFNCTSAVYSLCFEMY